MKLRVSITLNGRVWTQDVEPRLLRVHFIREIAGLTGTKIGWMAPDYVKRALLAAVARAV